MRREAAAAAVAAAAEAATVEESVDVAVPAEVADENASSSAPLHDADPSPATTKTDDDLAIAKLLSGPALPFLSTDPAVAPRNGSATRPTHLSMRRMKSVEVLSKIIRERRTVRTPTATTSSILVDMDSGTISPTHSRRSTPPRLTVSSPRGISSPKELALEGMEFEPTSWSPNRGGVMISNRKLAKKPRSRLRHVSSGSDLRSVAAADALKMPRRGRSKSRAAEGGERGPVAALIRDSVGTLSRSQKPRALRHDMHVFDENKDEGGQDDSPTRSKARRPQRGVLALSRAENRPEGEEDDVFRPVLRKKDLAARVTRTSKIMRLIEQAENLPLGSSDDGGELSGSLSRRSRERMHTITRVLGQKQPA